MRAFSYLLLDFVNHLLPSEMPHRGVQQAQRLQVFPGGIAAVQPVKDCQPVHVACRCIRLAGVAGSSVPAQSRAAGGQPRAMDAALCRFTTLARQPAGLLHLLRPTERREM